MSEFRDPPEERLGFAVCLKVGGVDGLDVLEEYDALLIRVFFFVLFVDAS